MKDVPFTILLPLAEIVDALRPDVVNAVLTAKPVKVVRRNLPETLLRANRDLAAAYTRYEASLGTRDEGKALTHLLATVSGTRAAFKNLKNPL
ncbi:hypothetical protein [Rhizobium sp. 18055]|uniref:hypothetical protein n=1 Tax=Rhizobium sp. 18055 TaxID=2681403 RepID=UPI00135B8C44|nr:hypothetical protein [Rhizobium sp. 18055]